MLHTVSRLYRRATLVRTFASGVARDHYSVLGVSRSATSDEIKQTFRKRAIELHPDTKASTTEAELEEFARLLSAYQVLTDERQRPLYDLSIDKGASAFVRQAASASPQAPGNTEDASGEFSEWRWGLGKWAVARRDTVQQGSRLDRLRAELTVELHAALQHAYLGPRIEEQHAHQLPDHFEAEERSHADTCDVLHLVSGRQLLGIVRKRHSGLLNGELDGLHGLPDEQCASAELPQSSSTANAPSALREPSDSCAPTASHTKSAASTPQMSEGSAGSCVSHDSPPHEEPGGPAAQQSWQGQAQLQGRSGAIPMQPPVVLDLFMADEMVASAVKQTLPATHPPKNGVPCTANVPESDDAAYASDSSRMIVTVYGSSGEVLASEEDGRIWRGGSEKQHTHRVLSGVTPLVRHLHFLAEVQGGKPVAVCKARRAWLPPSATWLFPPRSDAHSAGGWYFEWAGHALEHHPLWLHPAVLVFLAAFDTLSNEQSRQQGWQPASTNTSTAQTGIIDRLARGNKCAETKLSLLVSKWWSKRKR